jgi:hypothetical protein
MADLTTREGLSRLLTITDHKRDFSGDRLVGKLVGPLGDEVQVGATFGEPVGEEIIMNLSFDGVPEGTYQLQVCGPDEILFPADDRTFQVEVLNGC